MRRIRYAEPVPVDLRAADAPAPLRRGLPAAVEARPRRRPLFHPATGWFRKLERDLSHALSRSVWPYVPGVRAFYGAQLERGLTVVETEARLRGLPPSLAGLAVLLVSDLHVGPFLANGSLDRVLGRLMALRPDLVLVVGDVATSRIEEVEAAAPVLRQLVAPLGAYAVLGNHDHYTREPERVREILEASGIGVLHNRSARVGEADGGLAVAGIDDWNVGAPDLPAALEGVGPGHPVVLLSHNPDVLFEASARGVPLVLSGHTHAGQIRLPGLPVLARMSRYRLDHGRYRAGGTELIVSAGLGAVGVPLRVACPPEAVLLRLRA